MIYMLANGQGKSRGTTTGLAETAAWRTVVMSTGESKLVDHATQEGARARVLSLSGAPLGSHGAERAERLVRALGANHGHAGRRLLEWLTETDRAAVRARYDALLDGYSDHKRLPNALARRLARYVSLLELVGEILHGPLGVEAPTKSPIEELWTQVCADAPASDRGAEALRTVWSHMVANPGSFKGRETGDRDPNGGWLGFWPEGEAWTKAAWFVPQIHKVLRAAGHVPESILRQWAGRNWLILHGKTTHTAQVSVPGFGRPRCVVIKREAINEIDGAEETPVDMHVYRKQRENRYDDF
jgi:hypothetical protein